MQTTFETLINSFVENRVGIAENFLSPQLAGDLKNNLIRLSENRQMLSGGTGQQVSHDKSVRSDAIYWLDKKHNDVHENAFFVLMDAFILHLNNSCYTGINGYEFHYALYETGSFYKKHIDQFRNNSGRQYSMIIYLNTDWVAGDGGQLSIHHEGKASQEIDPVMGKTVFFKSSELEHEVLVANKPRMSITGWLKRD